MTVAHPSSYPDGESVRGLVEEAASEGRVNFGQAFAFGRHFVITSTFERPDAPAGAEGFPLPSLRLDFFDRGSRTWLWSTDAGLRLPGRYAHSPVLLWMGRPALAVLTPGADLAASVEEPAARIELLRFDAERRRVTRSTLVERVSPRATIHAIVHDDALLLAYEDFDAASPDAEGAPPSPTTSIRLIRLDTEPDAPAP